MALPSPAPQAWPGGASGILAAGTRARPRAVMAHPAASRLSACWRMAWLRVPLPKCRRTEARARGDGSAQFERAHRPNRATARSAAASRPQ